ncbi:hypothetical protein F4777DRAFT_339798 [Nemania sp. FL0916]|nr:hypothetical protein F4777DRAFT_339798 [Nemania sp. FL0916]
MSWPNSDRTSQFGHNNSDDQAVPTHHRPWPLVAAFDQGQFERQFLQEGQTIDFDGIPHYQFWFRAERLRVRQVLVSVAKLALESGRPLTGTEANAVGQCCIDAYRWISWSFPLGAYVALGLTLAGRRTFRFPFYTPKSPKFDPHVWPARSVPILKGRQAVFTWHVLRWGAYLIPATMFGGWLFSSMAFTSYQTRLSSDARLNDLLRDARHRLLEHQQQHLKRLMPGSPGSVEMTPPRDPRQLGDSVSQDAPAPPSSGPDDFAAQSSRAFGRPGAATPPPHRSMQVDDSSNSGSRRGPSDSDLFDLDDDDDDDDASPVAASARRSEAWRRSSGPVTWDRIRKQAASSENPDWDRADSSGQERGGWAQLRQDKTRNPKETPPNASGYSYSKHDEERMRRDYEKEQAQKDFDALVEAERRGDGSNKRSRG